VQDIIHNREGADEKEVSCSNFRKKFNHVLQTHFKSPITHAQVKPSVVVHKLEGLEEFCQKAQGSIFCEKAQGL